MERQVKTKPEGMIVYISGKQRSGKDTAATFLANNYGFKIVSLARPVYSIARTYFGMRDKDRELLVAIGDGARHIDPLVWVKYLWNEVKMLPRSENIVVPDVRYENEMDFFESKGAIGIRVEAEQHIRSLRNGYDKALESHHTETQLDSHKFKYVYNNNNSLGFDYDSFRSFFSNVLNENNHFLVDW